MSGPGPNRKRQRIDANSTAAPAASSSTDTKSSEAVYADTDEEEEVEGLLNYTSLNDSGATDCEEEGEENASDEVAAIADEIGQMFLKRSTPPRPPPVTYADRKKRNATAASASSSGASAATAAATGPGTMAPAAAPPAAAPAAAAATTPPPATAKSRAALFYGPDARTFEDEVKAAIAGKEELLRRRKKAEERREKEMKEIKEKMGDETKTVWVEEDEKQTFEPYDVPEYDGPEEGSPEGKDYSDIKEFDGPLSFFKLFFDNETIDHIVTHTNINGQKSDEKWSCNRADIRAMLGTLLLMSSAPMRPMRRYWHMQYGWPAVSNRWSRDRWMKLWWNLHINTAPPPPDKHEQRLWEAQPFVDMINRKWSAALNAGRDLTIDETMIAYRGRHVAVQYMPKKPITIGFKCFTISTLKGYCFTQKLYPGKHDNKKLAKGFTTQVVKDLIQPYANATNDLNKYWRCVCFDSFYTNAPLVKWLYERGVLSVGTIRSNRLHVPPAFRETIVKPDTFIARQSKYLRPLIAVCHVRGDKPSDKRMFMSTATPIPIPITEQNVNGKSYQAPHVSEQYNRMMGGVDTSNQYAAQRSPWRQSRGRWWLAVFLHYFHVSVANAYMLYSIYGSPELPTVRFGEFREMLAEQLLDGFVARSKRGRPQSQNTGHHEHVQTDDAMASGRRKRGRCHVCCKRKGSYDQQKQKGNVTGWKCKQCDVWVCRTTKNCWRTHMGQSAEE